MQTAMKKNKIIVYAVCIFFFLLAGFFQLIDSKLPEFYHALCALLAHTILIALVVIWLFSLVQRMVRKDLKSFFVIVAILILFFLVVRMIKYGLTESIDTLSRYMWYSYYVPQMLIPPTLLLATLSIENTKGKPLNKKWYLVYIPALILLTLIYTNDLHQLVFKLKFSENELTYNHQVVFYIALSWEIIITIISLIMMILKCRVSACKKKTWIPILTFLVCGGLSTMFFVINISAFKIPELLCFTCIMTIESCIGIGLIPTNNNYQEYFYHSKCSAFITDKEFNVKYKSKNALDINKELLETAVEDPIMLNDNIRLLAKKIHGGYVFRCEDLSSINKINAILEETNERILEENDLIEAENEIKEQQSKVDAQKKIYAKIEKITSSELNRLNTLLSEIKKITSSDDFLKKMQFACVLGAYIKRRSNIIILEMKNNLIDIDELALSINESLDYLSLLGVEGSLDFNIEGELSANTIGYIYDFFEKCTVRFYDSPIAIVFHISNNQNNINVMIESDAKIKDAIEFQEQLQKQFSNSSLKVSDEVTYYSLIIPCGGNL